MVTGVEFVDNILRGFFWSIARALLEICDIVYGFVKTLLSFDYLNSSELIWNWFLIMTGVFTAIFITFRVGKNFLLDAAELNEDREPRIDMGRIMVRLICVALVLVLAKPVLSGISYASAQFTSNIEMFVGSEGSTFSSVILEAGGIEAESVSSWTGDINEKADGGYLYFASFTDLVLMLIISFMAIYLMVLIGFSVGNRFISMIVKLIISPYAFSSLIERNPESFSIWCRSFLADFFANFVVLFTLIGGLTVVLNVQMDVVAKCLLILGALSGVLAAPNIAGTFIGADIGAATGMQSLQMLSSMGGGVGAMMGAIGGFAGGIAARGTYGIGRMLGGIDRHDAQLYDQDGGSIGSGVSSNVSSSGSNAGKYGRELTQAERAPKRQAAYDVNRKGNTTFAHNFANKRNNNIVLNTLRSGTSLVARTAYSRAAKSLNAREVSKYGGAKDLKGYQASQGR